MLRYIIEPSRHFPPKRLYSSREEILHTIRVTSKRQAVFESDQWYGETKKQSKLQKAGRMEWARPAPRSGQGRPHREADMGKGPLKSAGETVLLPFSPNMSGQT